MPNLDLVKKSDVSSFRRIAIGTWANAYDPTVYGELVTDMEEAYRYIDAFRERTGKRLTINHMVCRAVGEMFSETPDANAVIRWNRIYLRKRVGAFFQVVMEDPETGQADLSGCTIYDPEKKSLLEILGEFEEKATKVRQRKDMQLEHTRSTFKKIPFLMLNWVMKMISFFSFTLNLDLRWAKIPQDPFGSCMVTNVGSLGLDHGFVPLVPYSKVPFLICLGRAKPAPVAVDGKVEIRRVMRATATFDHRVLDGAHLARLSRCYRRLMEHPFDHFEKIEDLPTKEELAAKEAAAPAAES